MTAVPKDEDDPKAVLWWKRLCAGVHWLRVENRAEYRFLMEEIAREGGDHKAWSREVQQAAKNGLVVPIEFEPKPGVQATC